MGGLRRQLNDLVSPTLLAADARLADAEVGAEAWAALAALPGGTAAAEGEAEAAAEAAVEAEAEAEAEAAAEAALAAAAAEVEGDEEEGGEAAAAPLPPPSPAAIVYVASRGEAEAVAAYLNAAFPSEPPLVDFFHARRPKQTKRDLAARFQRGRLAVLVSTTAFGLGIDADVECVVQWGWPTSGLSELIQGCANPAPNPSPEPQTSSLTTDHRAWP